MNEIKFGRKPFYDDATIRATVQQWEQRYNTSPQITLAKFLEEQFGRREDGSPIVPPETFYGWRKRFMKNSEN